MGQWIKENLVLISGILLPMLLVAGFFVLSRAPAMLADPPGYDFILVGYHYDYQHESNYTLDFEVRDGHLTARATRLGGSSKALASLEFCCSRNSLSRRTHYALGLPA